MRSEEEIKNRIASIKGDILNDIMNGCFTDRSLQKQRDWVKCLEWVLQQSDNRYDKSIDVRINNALRRYKILNNCTLTLKELSDKEFLCSIVGLGKTSIKCILENPKKYVRKEDNQ